MMMIQPNYHPGGIVPSSLSACGAPNDLPDYPAIAERLPQSAERLNPELLPEFNQIGALI